jgi:hypothetical protein
MYQLIQLKTKTFLVENSINRSPLRYGLLFITLALTCFALSPGAQAVDPQPDGGYPGDNTAEGDHALFSLVTGIHNTAIASKALYSDTDGNFNTATGVNTLHNNAGGRLDTRLRLPRRPTACRAAGRQQQNANTATFWELGISNFVVRSVRSSPANR